MFHPYRDVDAGTGAEVWVKSRVIRRQEKKLRPKNMMWIWERKNVAGGARAKSSSDNNNEDARVGERWKSSLRNFSSRGFLWLSVPNEFKIFQIVGLPLMRHSTAYIWRTHARELRAVGTGKKRMNFLLTKRAAHNSLSDSAINCQKCSHERKDK